MRFLETGSNAVDLYWTYCTTGASETGGQFRVIKVIMYNWVLALAVTMRENTHWDQAGAYSKALPGRLRNMSYISQNNYFRVFANL